MEEHQKNFLAQIEESRCRVCCRLFCAYWLWVLIGFLDQGVKSLTVLKSSKEKNNLKMALETQATSRSGIHS